MRFAFVVADRAVRAGRRPAFAPAGECFIVKSRFNRGRGGDGFERRAGQVVFIERAVEQRFTPGVVPDLLPPTLFGLRRAGRGRGPFEQGLAARERAVTYYVRRAGPQRVIADDPAVEVAIFRQRTPRVVMTVVDPSPQRALGLAAVALVTFVLQGREDRALAERPRREQPPVDVKAERRHHHQRKRPTDVAQTAAGQPRPEVFGNFGLGLIEFGRARTITPRRGAQREDQSRHADQKNNCRNKRKTHTYKFVIDFGKRISATNEHEYSRMIARG